MIARPCSRKLRVLLVLSPLYAALPVLAQEEGTWGGPQTRPAARPYLRPMQAPDAPPAPYRPAAGDPAPPASGARTPPPARPRAPATALRDGVPAPIDRGDLAPVMAPGGSGMPLDMWNGLDLAGVEKLMSEISIPPRSGALHDLWKRLITARESAPGGEGGTAKFASLRLEALYRSGLAGEALSEAQEAGSGDPVMAILTARNELANANREAACKRAAGVPSLTGGVPGRLKAEAILLNGYCAAAAGDAAGAGLAAELAREEGLEQSAGLTALDALSINAKPPVKTGARLSLLDWRLMEIAGTPPQISDLEKAEPALLVALTNDGLSPPDLRLAAAEAGARLNAVSPDALAAIYSALGPRQEANALLTQTHNSTPLRRAALFNAVEGERAPVLKARLMRALLEDARRNGLGFQTMRLLARACAALPPQSELASFIDTAAEIGLAAGDTNLTRKWVALSPSAAHWLALADIADPAFAPHGQYMGELETLARAKRFTPDALHRLATVLDALGYLVPIPLWEAASLSPQPAGGHLPETGVLPELLDAARKKEFAHTVLLAMKTLGPDGAEGAHMIALGDSIRALAHAGLEADARRLGLEALLGAWPRTAGN